MSEGKAVAKIETSLTKLSEKSQVEMAQAQRFLEVVMDATKFEVVMRLAEMYASSQFGPLAYRDKIANCIVAIEMSWHLRVATPVFMSNTYEVHNKIGMEAKLAIALANERGPFDDAIRFRYEGEGDSRSCTAWARLAKSGDLCEAKVDWAMVVAEGWNKPKKGTPSKWMTIPEQMFAYRSSTFLIRRYCPGVLMGMHTTDELEDIGPKVIDITDPSPTIDDSFNPDPPAEKPCPVAQEPETTPETTKEPTEVAEPVVEPGEEPLVVGPEQGEQPEKKLTWSGLNPAEQSRMEDAAKDMMDWSKAKLQEIIRSRGAEAVAKDLKVELD
jgi:hypothetical protein